MAIVLSSAVPSEPPICDAVFTIAEATPASRGSTRWVAVLKAGTITQEIRGRVLAGLRGERLAEEYRTQARRAFARLERGLGDYAVKR